MMAMRWFDALRNRMVRTRMQMMGAGLSGNFRQNAYKNAVVRETVDAIARHAAKLNAVHMRAGVRVDDDMQYIVGMRPNPLMSAYDFQYKLFTHALIKNNAFAFPVWTTRGTLRALIPIDYSSYSVLEDERTGEAYVRFALINGREVVLPYAELIHLRRHYSEWIVMGSDNEPLDNAVEMLNIANAGMMSAVKSGSSLRGILKLKQSQLKDKDVKKRRDDFVKEYMDDNAGVAGLDASMDYVQLDPSKMYNLTTEQMGEIRANVYRYFGVSEKFVRGEYSENDWNATYEAVMEPLALQLHMEYTQKLFTAHERAVGEEIVFEANRMQYASVSTKVDVVNRMGMLGIITYDEAREIFNMPPLADGEGKKLIPPWNGDEKSKLKLLEGEEPAAKKGDTNDGN